MTLRQPDYGPGSIHSYIGAMTGALNIGRDATFLSHNFAADRLARTGVDGPSGGSFEAHVRLRWRVAIAMAIHRTGTITRHHVAMA